VTIFKILELIKDPGCGIDTVAAVIGRDGGLTAQILREANSALYGFGSTTSSIPEACVRLGLKRIRTSVLNQHIVNGLGKTRPPSFDAHYYWQSAFATNVAAHDLCRELLPESAEDAGTSGLLCDIGVGLMAFGIPRTYQRVLEQVSRSPSPNLAEIEKRELGVTHAEVGAAILAGWRVDGHIIEAVSLHHTDPLASSDTESSRFAQVVAAGVALSRIAMNGSDMDSVQVLFAQVDALTPDADTLVGRVLDQLVNHIQSTAESFSVELGAVDRMEANFEDLMRDMPSISRSMSFQSLPPDGAPL
jgi:HD-like signal output (HDOD) protein